MKIAVLGTGRVGHALSGKLVSLGHEVTMGSRESGNPKGEEWAKQAGPLAHSGSFADAAAQSELIVNATPGTVTLAVLAEAGDANLNGKILLDVAKCPRYLKRFSTIIDSLQHRQHRGDHPTDIPGCACGEVLEHSQRPHHGGSGAPPRPARHVHGRKRSWCQGHGCRPASGIWLGTRAHPGSRWAGRRTRHGDVAATVVADLYAAAARKNVQYRHRF